MKTNLECVCGNMFDFEIQITGSPCLNQFGDPTGESAFNIDGHLHCIACNYMAYHWGVPLYDYLAEALINGPQAILDIFIKEIWEGDDLFHAEDALKRIVARDRETVMLNCEFIKGTREFVEEVINRRNLKMARMDEK